MNAPDDPESGGGQEERIRALERKANQALSDAELLLENGSREAAINRAYYAVFQAAQAALLTEGEDPKTHSGVIRRFGYHFIRTERVDEQIGGVLTTAQSMRGRADYDAFSNFTQGEAKNLTEDARQFVRAVRAKILPHRE